MDARLEDNMYERKYHIQWPFRPHMPHTTETFCGRSIYDAYLKLCKYDPHKGEFYFMLDPVKRYVLSNYQVCQRCAKQAKMRIMPL